MNFDRTTLVLGALVVAGWVGLIVVLAQHYIGEAALLGGLTGAELWTSFVLTGSRPRLAKSLTLQPETGAGQSAFSLGPRSHGGVAVPLHVRRPPQEKTPCHRHGVFLLAFKNSPAQAGGMTVRQA